MLEGLKNTLLITLGALLIGVVIGTLIAVTKYFGEESTAFKPLVMLCDLYVTVIRGVPVVVLLLVFYFIILTSANGVAVAVLTFGINSGAYVAELIRSGIMSIDGGQMEAGRSLGLGYVQSMRYIILPQAFKNILPALANEFIVLIKETAVAGYVGLADLTYAGSIVAGNSYTYFVPMLGVAAIYLIIVMFFTWLVGKLERRLRASER